MGIEDLSFHCRNCSTEHKPYPGVLCFYVEYDFSKAKVIEAFRKLRSCKSLFFFHTNIIATGPDSFVLIDEKKDSQNVIKIYTKTSFERIKRYKKEMEDFRKSLQDKNFHIGEKDFQVIVNPIIDVFQLENGCVAATSKHIPLQNEYSRYQECFRSVKNRDDVGNIRTKFPINYEELLFKEIGVYIDPRNFAVDEENDFIVITDMKSSFEGNE